MALTPITITAALQSAGPEFLGPTFPPLALAIGIAVHSWAIIPANLALTGVTAGTAGAGVVIGAITVPPNPAVAVSIFAAGGVVGPNGVALARAIGVGIPSIFSTTAQYTGISAGVSSGSDISKVIVANPATLVPLLLASMQSNFGGSLGASSPAVANAISNTVASLLITGFTTPGTGIVAPTTIVPIPGVGTSPLSVVF